MTRSIRTSSILGALVGLGAILVAGQASADLLKPKTVFKQIQSGIDAGPIGEANGPGSEQSTSTWVKDDQGNLYVVTVYMSSAVSEEDGPWQGKCASVMLQANDAPKLIADKQISAYNNGDRLFNHPKIASNGTHIVYLFGSDGNVTGQDNGNVQTYAGVLNHMCEVVSEPIRISANNNNNEGAPDIVHSVTMNGDSYFTAGYLSTGGEDISYARGLVLHADGSLEKTYLTGVVTPANIGRPTIAALSDTRAFFCAAQGDNRPPEDGVRCAMLDVMTGDIHESQIVAQSIPDQKIYMNQPQLALLDNGRVALMVVQSDGAGKNNNNKGANIDHIWILTPNDDGFVENDHIMNVGPYQAHPGLCAGKYDVSGEVTVAMMDASVTGVGQPGLQMIRFDPIMGMKPVDKFNDLRVVGFHGDSGYLANLYGQNPNTQGRDFLRCIGDVPNPGYGVAGGYMPTVETFFVAPHSGRKAEEEKNALFISFVPGKVDEPVPPAPPEPADTPADEDPITEPETPGGTSDPTDPPRPGAPPTSVQFPGNAQSGCACSTPSSDSSGAPAALALAALAGLLVSRRRREEG